MFSSLLGNIYEYGSSQGKTCTDFKVQNGMQRSNSGSTCGLINYNDYNSVNETMYSFGLANLVRANYTTNRCPEAVLPPPVSVVAVTQVNNI
jgi:hypothetical protein